MNPNGSSHNPNGRRFSNNNPGRKRGGSPQRQSYSSNGPQGGPRPNVFDERQPKSNDSRPAHSGKRFGGHSGNQGGQQGGHHGSYQGNRQSGFHGGQQSGHQGRRQGGFQGGQHQGHQGGRPQGPSRGHSHPDRGERGFQSRGEQHQGYGKGPKKFTQRRNQQQKKQKGPSVPTYHDNRSTLERMAAKKKPYRSRFMKNEGAASPAVSKVYGEPEWNGGNPQSRNPKFGGRPREEEQPKQKGKKQRIPSPQRAAAQQPPPPKPVKPKKITNVPPVLGAIIPEEPAEQLPIVTQRRKGRGQLPQSDKSSGGDSEGHIRLNKFLSIAGFCSRRKADELIQAGRVKINGVVADELGTKIDPLRDKVFINEKQVVDLDRPVYILFNKPKDCITTSSDEKGRTTVLDYVKTRERVYPVGRLDRNTTGVLLLTNDGEFANRMMHPRHKIKKAYKATLDKPLLPEDASKLRDGVRLSDGKTKPAEVHLLGRGRNHTEVAIVIEEGRNRQVHRMFEALEYLVEKLERVAYAGISTEGLPRGEWRYLTPQELRHLMKEAGVPEDPGPEELD